MYMFEYDDEVIAPHKIAAKIFRKYGFNPYNNNNLHRSIPNRTIKVYADEAPRLAVAVAEIRETLEEFGVPEVGKNQSGYMSYSHQHHYDGRPLRPAFIFRFNHGAATIDERRRA